MAIRKAGSQTIVNRGSVTAAATLPVNIITGSSGGPSVNITSIQIANSTFHVKDDLAIDTAGGYIIVNGTGFKSGAVVYIQGEAATTTSFVNSSRLNATVPALSSGLLDVYVVNTDGSGSIYLRSLNANGVPSWTTTSPLASQVIDATFAINLVATGAAGDGTITYAVSSGSTLPPGTSLASNGYFYGTVTGLETETTYSFSVDAIDAQNQETARSFNITFTVNDTYFRETVLLINGETSSSSVNNNVFVDSSNVNHSITRNGNVTQGTFSPYGDNWSNYFDGTGDYLSLGGQTAFAFGTGDFTIEYWYYSSNSGVQHVTYDSRPISVNGAYMATGKTSGNVMFTYVNSAVQILGTTVISANTWYHIAISRSGTTTRLFVNGIQDGSATDTTNYLNGSSRPAIGIDGIDGTSTPVLGYISNLRVVKGTAVYTAAFTPPTAPLTAITNTSLLTCQSNRFIDNSTNAFAITVNGNTSVQRFSPFSPTAAYASGTIGGSGYFDGTGDYLTIPANSSIPFASGERFTIEGWIYPLVAEAGSVNGIYSSRTTDSNDYGVVIALSGNPLKLIFEIANQNGPVAKVTGTTTITAGSWFHFAGVYDGTALKLYVNGVSEGTPATTSQATLLNTAAIGRYYQNFDFFYFNGYINNLRIVKGTAVYTTNFTLPTQPVTAIANTSLLCNFTNAGIVDATAKNVLETVGNAQLSTAVKKFGSSSIAFDGSGDYLYVPSSINYGYGTGDFTIEFWLYLNSTGLQTIVSHLSSNPQVKPHIYYSSGVRLYVNGADVITGGVVTVSTWTHIALSRSATSTKLFINGTQSGSTYTDSNNYGTSSPLIIADYAVPATGTNMLNGYIDDLRITKGVARYTSNFTAPTSSFSLK